MFYLLIVAPTLFFMLMALVFLESYLKDTTHNLKKLQEEKK